MDYTPPAERVLLVGEYNPHSRASEHALLPWPVNSAGFRLRLILGMTPREYIGAFDRANLLDTARWSARLARVSAALLAHQWRVLLGAKVCAAHGVPFEPFKTFCKDGVGVALVLPHPSGRCRIWNDRRNVTRARRAVRQFLKEAA